ncbi:MULTISPECIES: universal stress protein [unclassified Variovorax]|jgi:nucleotide-binding universal stress UspA family protein|uniref:universal stress protein n=1 Tax=unclassified Variovorax TaxID=663243 RepID=UPI000B2E572A|nr:MULTISPECIES: universal stress protein [unclassified Variovorax]MBS79735.1 universal stress protein UspA [Variovorax sp.]MCT8177129.1 universal stress protein [Variovorax sp. CY25R-8]
MNTLRSILVHLDGTDRAEVRLRLAHRLAALYDSTLAALFAVSPRVLAVLPMMGGLPPMPTAGDIDPEHRAHAVAVFERLLQDHASRSDWRELRGEPVVESFIGHALTCDLMVLGQRNPRDTAGFDVPSDFVEAVLLGSGKPALVVPAAGRVSPRPEKVLLAWRPTRESARALETALPLLQAAQEVHLAPFAHGDDFASSLSRLRGYLRLHGIGPVLEHRAPDEGRHAGEALLLLAEKTGAGLIVMGAYGHSPARELVLGGATRTVLESATIPVWMAH